MKKVVWCLWLVLATPSIALGSERKDGAYYCTVKFAGGIAYNDALKEWEGSTFKPSGNFVVKLSFHQPTNVPVGSRDEYDVTITEEGSQDTTDCIGLNGKRPALTLSGWLSCDSLYGINEYKFNFNNQRFIKIYTSGYISGRDNNDDTPAVSGGLCTKIQ
jgi:hypothetical protein